METPQIIDETLKKIARGTTIVFLGTVVGMLLGLGSRIIIVRHVTQAEYGVYALALVLLSIFTVIATLGLGAGSTRYIAYFRGSGELSRIKGVVSSSLGFTLIASILLSLALFFASDALSTKAFHNPELSTPLKILSATIPFSVSIGMLTAVFRGFDRVDVKVYFQDLLRGALFLLLLVAVTSLGLSFLGVIYAYLASFVIACLAFAAYFIRRSPLPVEGGGTASPVRKELLFFSLPLLANVMLVMIMHWTDTLMLGYFKTSQVVGLYNAALPLAETIRIPLTSMAFIYVPVISQLYSRGLMNETKRSYQILTKWIFVLSLPLFLLLMVFPGDILKFFYGVEYIEAAQALRILALGLMLHTFVGANGMTLMVMGNTRLLMWASLLGAALNVALNVILIPPMGITGAAIASMAAYVVINSILTTRLYQLYGIHPFTGNYLKPLVASGIIVAIIYATVPPFIAVTGWMLPLFLLLFLGIYGLSLLLTKSFDNEDISLLLALEERTGVDATPIKRILRRFI